MEAPFLRCFLHFLNFSMNILRYLFTYIYILLVLGVILEFVYFVLSIDILQQIWERMPKTIASLSSGADWVSKAELASWNNLKHLASG